MIRKRIMAGVCLAGLLALHTAHAAEDGFVAGITDLPLIPGLHVVDEATVVFEKPGGRLVHAIAKGDRTEEAFWRFYEETLPQLGWRTVKRGKFVRDKENLHIDVEKNESQLIARFAIAPGK